MGVRDAMNRHSGITAVTAAAIVALVVLAGVLQGMRPNASEGVEIPERKSWYSTDDGKTWFADDVTKVPPFNKDGKQAVRAYVYRAPDGTEFVGYLERYTPAGKRAVEAAWSAPPEEQGEDPTLASGSDHIEIKKPGQANWIPISHPAADRVYKVISPKGQAEGLTMVEAK